MGWNFVFGFLFGASTSVGVCGYGVTFNGVSNAHTPERHVLVFGLPAKPFGHHDLRLYQRYCCPRFHLEQKRGDSFIFSKGVGHPRIDHAV